MTVDAHETYLESEVLQADGCRLVQVLYVKALDTLRQARQHLAEARIDERSRAITRTSEILSELALAVDHESGGEMSRNLVELYDYMQHRLQEANFKQSEPPLVEIEGLLRTLLEGWEQCVALQVPTAAWEPEAERTPVDCVG